MTKKRIKLPKEGFIEAEQPGTGGTRLEDGDVEGHSFATPAPPAVTASELMPSRSPSQGGEFVADDDDDDLDPSGGLRLKI